jgi:drug/metabolite transporter (DMT)-like permease
MTSPLKALHLKTRLFTTIVVLTQVLGNSFLSRGMQSIGELVSLSPVPYIRALFNPWVALGTSLLIVWLLSTMALLSWADLSYVLPVTSIGYVLAALVGRFVMHEAVSMAHWSGILLIMIGVALVGGTAPRTTKRQKRHGART